jgi:hypothetical protein
MGNGALALGGRNFEGKSNNQLGVGGRGGRDVEEEARLVWSMWGGVNALIWVSILTMKQKYTLALDGRQSIILHTTANQKRSALV